MITLVEGVGAGFTLTITGLSDDDLAEARWQVAAGNVGHILVLRIVTALVEALGVDLSAHEWTGAEYMALLEMLGMPAFQWSAAEDAALERFLAECGGEHG
ncbi:hypothetical protein NFX46_26655 [Streptomyces phaeoluteigriseus]|uniref:Phage tail tube protein, GTA-gp10 n=1 Tax=Streptomyces phaeoluteigriseus TaxID=114686 RepID=A0ABY4ZDG3_9ACTN|nr:hypothetical protein [Streptomyces phaeoluteigriseus]USQ86980.1 hypothetical protein NFX46_26655 [Streptomyces phaeoluteigriseus]